MYLCHLHIHHLFIYHGHVNALYVFWFPGSCHSIIPIHFFFYTVGYKNVTRNAQYIPDYFLLLTFITNFSYLASFFITDKYPQPLCSVGIRFSQEEEVSSVQQHSHLAVGATHACRRASHTTPIHHARPGNKLTSIKETNGKHQHRLSTATRARVHRQAIIVNNHVLR